MTAQPRTHHRWRFFRAGGLDQVRLESGADLAHLRALDPKLWVALACPVKGLELDEKTLALIDTDNDGRVRAPEVLAAVAFCSEALKDLDGLIAASDVLQLSQLNEATSAGKAALASARQVLRILGKASATSICLADLADTAAVFAKTPLNGDGVVSAACTDSPALAQVMSDIIATVGGEPDRGGATGVSQTKVDAFFADLSALAAWHNEAQEAGAGRLPLADATGAAAAAVAAVRAKIDDYFTRCQLAAFDPRAAMPLNVDEADYAAIAPKMLSAKAVEVASLPLARVELGRPLPLGDGLNPAWRDAMATFAAAAVAPLLGAGKRDLTEPEWAELRAKLAAHDQWAARKPVGRVEVLGLPRVRELLASRAKEELTAIIAADKAGGAELDGLAALEKLLRLHRDLFRLLHNFVAFTDFYAPDRLATFQAGTLYLDSRSCELCVRVDDVARHAAMAGLSKCYLAYCDCTRAGCEKMQIAAVFSAGDSDYLMVGRNGIFYDRKGRDWDATVTKIVENPISIRQAFWSPYKRFVRLVEEQLHKRAGAAEQAKEDELAKSAEKTMRVDAAPAAPSKKLDLGTIALIGVAVSGAAAAIGGLLEAFFGLGVWMPIGLAGLVLAISGPSMLIAGLKLRQRNLGPVLDANGWAVNGRVQLNIPFGGSLTLLPTFPKGAQRSLRDPYAPKRSRWALVAKVAALVAALGASTVLAYHQGWLPPRAAQPLTFLGVPAHLKRAKARALEAVEEEKKVVASAKEQLDFAKQALAEAAGKDEAALVRARDRYARAEAKHERALDKLDSLERRLERQSFALELVVDAHEARAEGVAVGADR